MSIPTSVSSQFKWNQTNKCPWSWKGGGDWAGFSCDEGKKQPRGSSLCLRLALLLVQKSDWCALNVMDRTTSQSSLKLFYGLFPRQMWSLSHLYVNHSIWCVRFSDSTNSVSCLWLECSFKWYLQLKKFCLLHLTSCARVWEWGVRHSWASYWEVSNNYSLYGALNLPNFTQASED